MPTGWSGVQRYHATENWIVRLSIQKGIPDEAMNMIKGTSDRRVGSRSSNRAVQLWRSSCLCSNYIPHRVTGELCTSRLVSLIRHIYLQLKITYSALDVHKSFSFVRSLSILFSSSLAWPSSNHGEWQRWHTNILFELTVSNAVCSGSLRWLTS